MIMIAIPRSRVQKHKTTKINSPPPVKNPSGPATSCLLSIVSLSHIQSTTSVTHMNTDMHEHDNCHNSQFAINYPNRAVVTFRLSKLMADTYNNLMELV